MVTILCSVGGLYLAYCTYLSISVLVSLHLESKQVGAFLQAQASMETASDYEPTQSTVERFTSYFWDVYLPASPWSHVLMPFLRPVRVFV